MPRRFLSPALLCSVAALSFAGCRSTQPDAPSPKPSASTSQARAFVSPRDDLNREIALSAPAKRVVVVGPGADETIFELGAGDKIVGRDSGADYPEAVKKIAVVADYRGPFVEACVAARPDLVLLQGETWGRERVESWQKKIGVPVAALAATTVDGVQKDADKIADWLGVKRRDLNLNPPLKSRKDRSLTAFIATSSQGAWTAGKGTLISDVVERSQFKNVADDVVGYKELSKEALLKRQPDVYIVPGKPEDKARIVADLKRDAGLSGLKCVQRGQVVVISGDFLLRPGPRLRDGIRALRDARSRLN